MAYTSNDTGHDEVYVQPFPPSGAKWQISTAGGARPIWRGDGKELFYVAADMKLMAVEVRWTPTIEVVGAKALFQTRFDALVHKLSFPYAPTADGQRFLVVTPIEEAAPMPLTVVLNWTALLGK
jgi:hypothetical protein